MLSSELITTIAHDISLRRSPNEKPAVDVPGEKLGEGDVQVIFDFLPSDIADIAFERLRTEVTWNVMYHRGTSTHDKLHHYPPNASLSDMYLCYRR